MQIVTRGTTSHLEGERGIGIIVKVLWPKRRAAAESGCGYFAAEPNVANALR